MTATDFVLAVIEAFGGTVEGRTLLQKRCFFVADLAKLDVDLSYGAHFYGPYSATVDNTVARLKSLGFLNEESTGFGVASTGFEIRRYDYRLTEDGKRIAAVVRRGKEYESIAGACNRIVDAGDPNYFILSIAAKAYFILNKKGRAMGREEIIREAEKFDWVIEQDALNRAVLFLDRLGVVHTSQHE